MSKDEFLWLDPQHTDPARLKRERDRAREIRKSPWWKAKVGHGVCHYCRKKFRTVELTMDHVIPLARGGTSVKNNLVPACRSCNHDKKLAAPVDEAFSELAAERRARGESDDDDR